MSMKQNGGGGGLKQRKSQERVYEDSQIIYAGTQQKYITQSQNLNSLGTSQEAGMPPKQQKSKEIIRKSASILPSSQSSIAQQMLA